MTIKNAFHITAFTTLVVWIFFIGKAVIVPLVIAIMLSYVLTGATHALRRLPIFSFFPEWLAYLSVLVLFGLALGTISFVAVENLRNIASASPIYQENVLNILSRISLMFGTENAPTWETLSALTFDRLDLAGLSLSLLATILSAGGYTVVIATYVVFMVAEGAQMTTKINLVISDDNERGAAHVLFERINSQIVTYLFTKTLINVALGVLSYAIMWFLGVENAVFWAFIIALFNYIPYVGSLIGVLLVVCYVIITGAGLQNVVLTLILLTCAQVYIGNWVEPRIMSRSFNLSAVVVLFALVFWSGIWGLTGAIIAVPMTSLLMIVLGEFEATRAIPILASRDGTLNTDRPLSEDDANQASSVPVPKHSE